MLKKGILMITLYGLHEFVKSQRSCIKQCSVKPVVCVILEVVIELQSESKM